MRGSIAHHGMGLAPSGKNLHYMQYGVAAVDFYWNDTGPPINAWLAVCWEGSKMVREIEGWGHSDEPPIDGEALVVLHAINQESATRIGKCSNGFLQSEFPGIV